jgi:hypothetical protein
MLDKIKAALPINWELAANPINWIYILLMIAIAGAAIAFVLPSAPPTQE